MSGLGEFELIERFFVRPGRPSRARLGVGDDGALLDLPAGHVVVVATDMLVAGRHFFPDVDPVALGHKVLAVNLSDLAAMGARPHAFTLALAIPEVDEGWLAGFSQGLFALADAHQCELVGGDTTRGPLTLCVTILGAVLPEQALRRDGAQLGDDVWVSGSLGGAAWELAQRLAGSASVAAGSTIDGAGGRLDWPQPRVALGLGLRGVATAAIDVSDGLVGDLGHVLRRSSLARHQVLGARLSWPDIPVDPALTGALEPQRVASALAGGDDYELVFTAPPSQRAVLAALAIETGLASGSVLRAPSAKVPPVMVVVPV